MAHSYSLSTRKIHYLILDFPLSEVDQKKVELLKELPKSLWE